MRIVIAEDSVLLREGITRLLAEYGHEVVAAEGDATRLLAVVTHHQPDLVIVDVRMPPTHTDEGLRAAVELRTQRPATPVLVLSLMAQGLSNLAVAERLVVSAGAVEKHISSIFTKLDLAPSEHEHRRVLAVLRYVAGE